MTWPLVFLLRSNMLYLLYRHVIALFHSLFCWGTQLQTKIVSTCTVEYTWILFLYPCIPMLYPLGMVDLFCNLTDFWKIFEGLRSKFRGTILFTYYYITTNKAVSPFLQPVLNTRNDIVFHKNFWEERSKFWKTKCWVTLNFLYLFAVLYVSCSHYFSFALCPFRLLPHIKGNVGFVFTKEDLPDIRDLLLANKVAAPAKAGAIAPIDVFVPKGNTGLGPEKTSFFQALAIPTKISKGTIEILVGKHFSWFICISLASCWTIWLLQASLQLQEFLSLLCSLIINPLSILSIVVNPCCFKFCAH